MIYINVGYVYPLMYCDNIGKKNCTTQCVGSQLAKSYQGKCLNVLKQVLQSRLGVSFLPVLTGLPSFPLASSSMQLRALVGWCWVALTTVERHSEKFNTGFVPVSIFHCCWCIVCFTRALQQLGFPQRGFPSGHDTRFFLFFKVFKEEGLPGSPFLQVHSGSPC